LRAEFIEVDQNLFLGRLLVSAGTVVVPTVLSKTLEA
jgi:hypothetical protein